MKPTKTSFLFFFLLAVLSHPKVISQQKVVDSIGYYTTLTSSPKKSEDLTKAFSFFKKQLDVYEKNNHLLGKVFMLISIAQTQKKAGFLNDSEKSAIDGLKILDKMDSGDDYVAMYSLTLYNHLGKIYRELEDYSKAHYYYDIALKKVKKTGFRITILNNKGFAYHEQEKYNFGIEYFKRAYDLSLKVSDTVQEARALDNIGFSQAKINNSNALQNLEAALRIRKTLKHNNGIFTSYMNLGYYYLDRNNLTEASYYANKVNQIIDYSKNIPEKSRLYELEFRLGDFSNYSEYQSISDSIATFERKSKNLYAALKYDKEKEVSRANENELKLNTSKLKQEVEKSQRITYQALLGLVLILTIVIIIRLMDKHKKEKIKHAYQKEIELSKKVHDELANDMSDLMNFVENDIEVTSTKKSLLLDNIEDIYLRTRDISTETGSIDLINFSESIKHLLMQHNRKDTKVVINNINTVNWENVADHKKMIVFRCLQELMVNMKKHSEAKLVSVVFKALNNKNEIRYADDGIGFEYEGVKQNGLLNMESRIKGIGGSFKFTTSKGKGCKATLQFNN